MLWEATLDLSTIFRRQYCMACLVVYGDNKHTEIVGWKEHSNYNCGRSRPDKTLHEVFEVRVSGAVVRYIIDEVNVDPSRCSPAVLPVQPIERGGPRIVFPGLSRYSLQAPISSAI